MRINPLAAALGIIALAGCGSTPIPQPSTSEPLVLASVSAPSEPTADVSTCDRAREAFLTGGAEDIDAALAALVADKTADAIAREYAQYYLERDVKDPDLRGMDKTLIQAACS